MIVDAHTHFLPREMVSASSWTTSDEPYDVEIRAGDEVLFASGGRAAGYELAQLVDPVRRLHDMDAMGVDRQVLSVPPPFGFFYGGDAAAAARLCRVVNRAISVVVHQYPDRFIGMATVPLQDPGAAAEELTYAVEDLGLGGAEIATRVGSLNLDAEELRPFLRTAQQLGTTLFVHSTRGLGAHRLADYHLGNLIGNPTEDAIAAASLIFGGVLDELPDLKIYIAHGGGSCAFLAGRWDRGWLVREEARRHLSAPPSTYLKKLRFDSLTHGDPQLAFLLAASDSSHVLLGTDYPYDMGEPDPVARVRRMTSLTAAQQQSVLGGNAQGLFGARSVTTTAVSG